MKLVSSIAVTGIALILAGCQGQKITQATVDAIKTEQMAGNNQRAEPSAYAGKPYFYMNTPYLTTTAIRNTRGEDLPPLLNSINGVTISIPDPSTLRQILDQISARTHLPIRIGNMTGARKADTSRQAEERHAVSYSGPISGLFDELAIKFGVHWTYRGGMVSFYRYEQRTFVISALPNEMEMKTGISNQARGGGNGSSGGGEGGGGASSTSDQSINTEIKKQTLVDGLEKALSDFIPDDCTFTMDKATGAIVVVATPAIMDQVSRLIHEYNDRYQRQVEIDVRVLTLTTTANSEYGLDIDAVIAKVGGGIAMEGGGVVQTFASNATSFAASVINSTSGGTTSRFAGTQAVIRALESIGTVAVKDGTRMVARNNTVNADQSVNTLFYLAKVSQTNVSNSGSQVSLTPDSITTGYNLQVYPRILSAGRVVMKLDISISAQRGELRTETSGGQSIKTPNVDSRAFSRTVEFANNQTMVLASYGRDSATMSDVGVGSPFNWLLGGGTVNRQERQYIIILVTPVVLKAPAVEETGEYIGSKV
jgi:Type II secretory pathway, component PulD